MENRSGRKAERLTVTGHVRTCDQTGWTAAHLHLTPLPGLVHVACLNRSPDSSVVFEHQSEDTPWDTSVDVKTSNLRLSAQQKHWFPVSFLQLRHHLHSTLYGRLLWAPVSRFLEQVRTECSTLNMEQLWYDSPWIMNAHTGSATAVSKKLWFLTQEWWVRENGRVKSLSLLHHSAVSLELVGKC